MDEATVPDIGDLFTYEGESFRVSGWLKRMARPEPPAWDRSPLKDVLDDLLYDSQQRIGPDHERLMFCIRGEAEYVSASGIAGRVVRVADVKVTGRVNWSEELFDHARHEAACLVGRPVW